MRVVDLEPAAERMAALITDVPDELLDRPTPCPEYTLADLLDHVGTLVLAFTAAATKSTTDVASQPASGDAPRLGKDWRRRIPRDLTSLAHAWRDPAAWSGMTRAGGYDMPGEFAGIVALDELVIHGWDVARATGQVYDCDPQSLEVVHGFVVQIASPGQEAVREGRFGPVVAVADEAPLLDRVIGLSGRHPNWSPS